MARVPARGHLERKVHRALAAAPLELWQRSARALRKAVQYRLDVRNQSARIERFIGADEQCARDQIGTERMRRGSQLPPKLLLELRVTVEPCDPEAMAPAYRGAKSNARVAGRSPFVHGTSMSPWPRLCKS